MPLKTNTDLKKRRLRKVLLLSSFFIVFFFLNAQAVHAGYLGDAVYAGFQLLLYQLFQFVGIFTSIATTVFAYAVDPQYVSGDTGLLNLQATYDMWKFVRDFINIFFILALLFIAFAFIFQIDSYSDKKVILKLVIAALLVNFSFPLSRVIIDLANVPMYFFLQMILGDGSDASTALSSALSASNLEAIILPAGDDSLVSTLIAAIVFLFIFNITLLVLGFQFLIRLIALVILVILSPIGFVASGIPGMKKYGSQWWDAFLKYCFFGPAAMFMLVLATNFFAAVSGGDRAATLATTASASSSNPPLTAAMVLFSIPIIMLWFAMGISSKFSIAGAGAATDYGKKFAKWTKKQGSKSYNNRYTRGAKKGLTERVEKVPVLRNLSADYRDKKRTDTEALVGGYFGGGKKGAQKVQDKMYAKKVAEQEKKFDEERTSESVLRATMKDDNADKVKREAAVRVLSKKEALRSGEDMQAAKDALALSAGAKRDAAGNVNIDTLSDSQKSLLKERKAEIVKKAGAEIYKTGDELASAIGDLGNDVKGVNAFVDKAKGRALDLNASQIEEISAARDENGNIKKDTNGNIIRNENIFSPLKSKIRKEGNSHNLVEYYAKGEVDSSTGLRTGQALTTEEAVRKVVDETKNIEDIVKQEDLFKNYAETSAYISRTFSNERFTQLKEEANKKSPKIASIL